MHKFSSIFGLLVLLAGVSWVTFKSTDSKVNNSGFVELEGARLEFLDLPVRVEEETHFVIHFFDPFSLNDIAGVSAKIEGVNMYMGVVQVFMQDFDDKTPSIGGSFFIGSCSEPHMKWRMFITIQHKNGDNSLHTIDFTTSI